jgi:hypothetical protein
MDQETMVNFEHINLCKNCKHHQTSSFLKFCKQPAGKIVGYSPIDGKPYITLKVEVRNMRYDGECGIERSLFERKIHITEKVVQFFKKVLE